MLIKIQPDKPLPKNGFLYFSAPWCVPCKTIKPILAGMTTEVYEINVDTGHELAQSMNITGIPTIIKVKDGSEVSRITGGKSKSDIERFIYG